MRLPFYPCRTLGLVLPAACCALLSSNVGAQPEDRTRPPAIIPPVVLATVADVAAIGAKVPGADVAAVGAKVPAADVAAVGAKVPGANVSVVGLSASAAKMPILVERLRAYSLTPQQAWEAGDLDVPDLIYFLESLDRWGGFTWEIDLDLRRQMVALLVQHGQQRLQQSETLSPVVRLWLADYYGSIGDKRVLALSESILREQKEPKRGENAIGYQAVERIAWFYRDMGQYEKAAEEWMRIDKIHKDAGWWGPHAMLEAAWTYTQGNEQKAEEAYKKVVSYNSPWATHTALIGLARLLIKQDKHEEVRRLLTSQHGENMEQRQISISSLLAESYYRSGDFGLAQSWSQKALTQYEVLNEVESKMGSDAAIAESSERLWWIQQWKTSPLVCWPPRLDVSSQEQEKPSFNIRSFCEVPLSVVVDDPRLRTTLKGKWQSAENGFCFDREVAIELLPSANKNSFNATITVTSSRFPNLKQKVKVYINQAPVFDKGGG